MPPTTSAVAAGTNAINATTRGCRWEGMVFRLTGARPRSAGSHCVVAFLGCTTATIVGSEHCVCLCVACKSCGGLC